MATVNSNRVFLSFDGVDLSAYWTGNVSLGQTAATVDVTAGSGATHTQRAVGLRDTSFSCSVVYDDADLASYVAALTPGTAGELVYGPIGSAAGSPKLAFPAILTSVDGPNATIDNAMQMFDLTFEAAGAPTASPTDGDVFA